MPDPTGRPLVEAWGVRSEGGWLDGEIWSYRRRAEQEASSIPDGTVVPLIAADRLEDEALVEALAREEHERTRAGSGGRIPAWSEPAMSETMRNVIRSITRARLAALQTHLESHDA